MLNYGQDPNANVAFANLFKFTKLNHNQMILRTTLSTAPRIHKNFIF